MQDVYKNCPVLENGAYLLRLVGRQDTDALLKVYSDEAAVSFFNSDNCNGDDFHYTTAARMEQAIDYWLWEYGRAGFVRWSVVSKAAGEAVGTIELFRRTADDFFTDCGLLRLDLRSDFEKAAEIGRILDLITGSAFSLFECSMIATKAIPAASERIAALESRGFVLSDEKLNGHGGTFYGDYFVLQKASF